MLLTDYANPLTAEDIQDQEAALRKLQANILAGIKRNCAAYGLMRFTASSGTVRAALRSLSSRIGTAWLQMQPTEQQPAAIITAGLSSSGFEALSVQGDFFSSFHKGFGALMKGITHRDPEGWEAPFDPVRRIDAIVSIAGWADTDVDAMRSELEPLLTTAGTVDWLTGFVRRRNGFATEHFGFADGISNPVFLGPELRGNVYPNGARPHAGPPIVLGLDRLPGTTTDDFGSYLVFLKLEQDVDGFKNQVSALAKVRNAGAEPSESDLEKTRGLLIGRDPSGNPIANPSATELNDFNFDNDRDGSVCPYGAHIRKMNPRTAEESNRRIARRSLLYESGAAKGVLFQCFQYNLAAQFEQLFANWGNASGAPDPLGQGLDPLIGSRQVTAVPQQWPVSSGGFVPYDIRSLVTVRGGEYFYLPSVTFFKNL